MRCRQRSNEAQSSGPYPRLSFKGYNAPPSFQDETYKRGIHLRREAGRSRVTVFEGGHEGIPEAAIAWLALHVRK